MNRTVTLSCAFLSAALLAASPAEALFGFGKKKPKAEESSKSSTSGKNNALPGMPGADDEGGDSSGGNPLPKAPSMSEAAANEAPSPSSRPQPSGDKSTSGQPTTTTLPAGSSLPTEVVIHGAGGDNKLNSVKPPLNIDSDPFESIRNSLKPDESLLLAESPLTISWRRTHPEFLAVPRVIQPWRTTFSERAGIAFYPLEQLSDAIGRRLEKKEAKAYQWSLTIADEEGRVFQHYEGSSSPPEELLWSGQNDQGEWIKAGRGYSPIFMFTDPGGSPHTKVGKTLQFTGIVHQEPDGLHVSLDSTVLFGPTKSSRTLDQKGNDLVRSAADLVKRRYSGTPVRVQAYSSTKELGDLQAELVQKCLIGELMLMPANVGAEGAHAAFADQRVEIILLNR